MAFRVRKLDHRRWPVTITLRDCQDDGSVVETASRFVGHFKPLGEAGILALRQEVFGTGSDEEMAKQAEARTIADQIALEAAFFARVLCGWEGVTDEADQPIPYTPEALTAMISGQDGPAIRRGISTALLEIRFGIAPAGNAATSPAPGPTPAAGEAPTN